MWQYNGRVIFDCPFDKLNCHLEFTQRDEWLKHSLRRFKIAKELGLIRRPQTVVHPVMGC